MQTTTPTISELSNDQLLAALKYQVADERRATTRLVRLLMEVDARRLYLREGFSSLFTYCTQALHLAEGSAYNRIEVARAARRFPVILELLEAGALTLTSIRLLAPHLTAENHARVLACARHKTKRDVEVLVATLAPKPDVVTRIRREAPTLVTGSPAAGEWGRCSDANRDSRCRETAFLEYHHAVPFAAGGEATVANIALRCRAHNQYEAALFFGEGGEALRERAEPWGSRRCALAPLVSPVAGGGPCRQQTRPGGEAAGREGCPGFV